MNPFYILGVDERADDETIRKAYLQAIRRFTPEKSPVKFREIAQAYDRIKDLDRRCDILLKSQDEYHDSPAEVLIERIRLAPGRDASLNDMKSFFRSLI